MASPRKIAALLLGLALLSFRADAMSFRTFRSYRAVSGGGGGGDTLAAGTGVLLGYGNVDFGRAGLASTDIVSGGVDGGGDFDAAVQLVSGKRGKIGSTAESAILLSKAGLEDRLLERGSFSLNDGKLKTRRLKDLLYKEADAGAAGAQAASYANGGERIKANDTSGFRNTYHLDESGTKSTFSDKYRHGTKFQEAGEESERRKAAQGRQKVAEKVDASAEEGRAKSDGAYLKGRDRASKEQRLIKAGLKKYLKDGQKEERRRARRRFLKKGDIGDLNDEEIIYDDDGDGDEEDYDEDELDLDEQRHYVV